MINSGQPGGAVRVGVLHPHRLVREVLGRGLEDAGFWVVGKYPASGRLLEAVNGSSLDVAVLDLSPCPDALALLTAARRADPAVRAVVVSSGSEASQVERWREAGASGYVDKLTAGAAGLAEAVRAVSQGAPFFLALREEPVALPPRESAWSRLLQKLTPRESEVLTHVAAGLSNAAIGAALCIREATVKGYLSNLYRKLAQKNRTQLALLARSVGMTVAEPRSAAGAPLRRGWTDPPLLRGDVWPALACAGGLR